MVPCDPDLPPSRYSGGGGCGAAAEGRLKMRNRQITIACLRSSLTAMALLVAAATPMFAETAAERLSESALVLKEVMEAPDKGIPTDLLAKAHCVVVVPGLKKAGLVVGGKYG